MSMTDLTGMDIWQVRSLARQLGSEANDIRGLIGSLTADVQGAPWRGTDRERFVSTWAEVHARALHRVADGLDDAAREADDYADRQEAASRGFRF